MSATFTLSAAEVPNVVRKDSVYTKMLDQFLTMKEKSVVVGYDKKAASVYISLKRTIKKHTEEYSKVSVVMRGENIYLVK